MKICLLLATILFSAASIADVKGSHQRRVGENSLNSATEQSCNPGCGPCMASAKCQHMNQDGLRRDLSSSKTKVKSKKGRASEE